jgi:hypothetical protein
MGLFGESNQEKEEFSIINRLLGIIENLTGNKPHPVKLVLLTKINNSKFQIMALSIAANQQVAGTLGLVDQVTSAAVTGTFAGTSAVSDTPAAFTANVDASGNVNVVAVAAGTGNLTVTTTAAYTDSTNTPQTASLSVVIPVAITAVVVADAVSLVVNFGTPTAAPIATPTV